MLSRLGYPDQAVDRLLAESLAIGAGLGPERLPHRRLEQAWLARLWGAREQPGPDDPALLAESMLCRPMDALGSTRLDVYAFTHALMYATDLGRRRVAVPRPLPSVAADAEAALAHSLDADDFDLTAEVLLTWPMLGVAWSPSAAFAFRILADVEDSVGFLPGSRFDRARYLGLSGHEQSQYALATSYHTAYVMGFLCAAALGPDRAPPVEVPADESAPGAGAAVLRLVDRSGPTSCWRGPFAALTPGQQDAVAPLVLAILLRRARKACDLGLVRDALELAVAHDLVAGPAPAQAAALLRRSRALELASRASAERAVPHPSERRA